MFGSGEYLHLAWLPLKQRQATHRCHSEGFGYLVVVIYWHHRGLPYPLHHQCVAEGDGEDGEQVGGYELVEDEGPLVRLGGEPVHAVLPGAVPVALLDVLVQEDGNGQDEGT